MPRPLGAGSFTDKDRLLQFTEKYCAYVVCIFTSIQVLQVASSPIPGKVTVFVGGILFGTFWGVVYSTNWHKFGSWIAFTFARIIGRPLVESVVSPKTVQRYDYMMIHTGLLLAFLLFITPGFPRTKGVICSALATWQTLRFYSSPPWDGCSARRCLPLGVHFSVTVSTGNFSRSLASALSLFSSPCSTAMLSNSGSAISGHRICAKRGPPATM